MVYRIAIAGIAVVQMVFAGEGGFGPPTKPPEVVSSVDSLAAVPAASASASTPQMNDRDRLSHQLITADRHLNRLKKDLRLAEGAFLDAADNARKYNDRLRHVKWNLNALQDNKIDFANDRLNVIEHKSRKITDIYNVYCKSHPNVRVWAEADTITAVFQALEEVLQKELAEAEAIKSKSMESLKKARGRRDELQKLYDDKTHQRAILQADWDNLSDKAA